MTHLRPPGHATHRSKGDARKFYIPTVHPINTFLRRRPERMRRARDERGHTGARAARLVKREHEEEEEEEERGQAIMSGVDSALKRK